jgi:hypothetical protein
LLDRNFDEARQPRDRTLGEPGAGDAQEGFAGETRRGAISDEAVRPYSGVEWSSDRCDDAPRHPELDRQFWEGRRRGELRQADSNPDCQSQDSL